MTEARADSEVWYWGRDWNLVGIFISLHRYRDEDGFMTWEPFHNYAAGRIGRWVRAHEGIVKRLWFGDIEMDVISAEEAERRWPGSVRGPRANP